MELKKEMILLNQQFDNKDSAIRASGELLAKNGCVDYEYIETMIERNDMVSVYMGNFIAIPHGTDESKKYVKKSGISILQVPKGVRFGKDDTEEVAMIIFGIAGIGNEHVEILRKIAVFCSDIENVIKLADAKTSEEIIGYLEEVE